MSDHDRILELRQVSKTFDQTRGLLRRRVGQVRAVDGVDLHLDRGETLALVGESGSGKTTLGRVIVRAIDPSAGEIRLRTRTENWTDLAQLQGRELRRARREFTMIFQDPYSSLDPRMTVLDIVREPLLHNKIASGTEAVDRVRATLDLVGLGGRHLRRYPHAFSGGQRQRIGIARALVSRPKVVVCDEPVSALDVSIQAQILNLLKDLQQELQVAFLFITHDLGVVEHLAHRVAVMYVGRLVESADRDTLFAAPKHPYTEALLSAAPVPDPTLRRQRIVLRGEVANPADPPTGCYFHPRCPYATEICVTEQPKWRQLAPGHRVACHHAEKLTLQGLTPGSSVAGLAR